MTATISASVPAAAASRPGNVRVLLDPADTVECVRALDACHRPRDGVVVCHPLPNVDRREVLAEDVLVALGKRPGCLASEHLTRRGWALAGLWLRAERSRHLVVLRAHLLPAQRWHDLSELAATADVVVWLVSHRVGLHTAQRAVLDKCGVVPKARPWRDALPQLTPASAAVADPGPFPMVPDVDFPTFRAAARGLLDPDAFARVDAVYRAVFDAARDEARQLQVLALRAAGADTDVDTWPAVVAAVQRMTVTAGSEGEVLTRLRAMQAGFFRQGTLLRVRLYRQRGRPGFSPRPRMPAPLVARLRSLCAPAGAAALTIRAATGLSLQALVGLRLGDALDRGNDTDNIDIRAEGGLWRIPGRAAALVRAALLDHPGRPEALLPLFQRDGAAMPARAMGRLLETAGARTGVHAVDRRPTAGLDSTDLQAVDGYHGTRTTRCGG